MADGGAFEPKAFATGLEDVEPGKELWLLRFPRKFPLDKLPKKLKLAGNGHGSGNKVSIGGRSFDIVIGDDITVSQQPSSSSSSASSSASSTATSSSAATAAELAQLHVVVGEGDDLEFGPHFTRQVNVVERVAIPELEPQSFEKPVIPPFHGKLTLQGTPSGYGTTPVKTKKIAGGGKAAASAAAAPTTAVRSSVPTPSKRSASGAAKGELPASKKSKRSPAPAPAAAAAVSGSEGEGSDGAAGEAEEEEEEEDDEDDDGESPRKAKKDKKGKKKKEKKKKKKKKKHSS